MENKAEKVSSLRAKLAARRQALDGDASALLSPEAAVDVVERNNSSRRVAFSGLDSFSASEASTGAQLPRSINRNAEFAVNAHDFSRSHDRASNENGSAAFEPVSRQHQAIHEATLDADARLRNVAYKENELRGIVSLIERKEADLIQMESKIALQKQELQDSTNKLSKKSRELAERDNQLRINFDLMVSREEDLKKYERGLQNTEQVMNQQANRLEQLEQDLASKLEQFYQRELQLTTSDSDVQKFRKQADQRAAENEAEFQRLKKYDNEVLMIKQDLQKQKLALESREHEFNRAVAEDSSLVRGLKEFEDNLKHKESHLETRIQSYSQNVSELDTRERELNSREQELLAESAHLASLMKTTKKKEADLAHEISQTRSENNAIQEQKTELSKREFQVAEAEKQMQLKSKRIVAAEKELDDRLLDIERLEASVAEQDVRIEGERHAARLQRKQLADFEKELHTLQAQLDLNQNQLARRAAEHNEKEAKFQDVVISFQKEKQRIETFANDSAAFAESLEEAKMELEENRKEHEASFQIARKQQDILDQRERNLVNREKKVRDDELHIESAENQVRISMEQIKSDNATIAANHRRMQDEILKLQSLEKNLFEKERDLDQKEFTLQQNENRVTVFQISLDESYARLNSLKEEKENVEMLTRNLEVQRHEMQLVRTKLQEYESDMEQTITDMDNQQLRIDEQKAELDVAMKKSAEVEREMASLRAREEVVRKNQLKYQELIDQAHEMIKNTSAKEERLKSRTEELELSQRQHVDKEKLLRVHESQVETLMKKLQSEQDRLLVQETEIEEYASQLDKTRDALLAKEDQLKNENQKAESRTISAEKMIRESLEKAKESKELELKLEQSKAKFESEKADFEAEKRFIHDHIQSIEAKEVEIEAKESALVHQQNVEFRKQMEFLEREYQTKAVALDERISAVYEFDLSHVEKMSRQESKITALEQEVQSLQKKLLEKNAQIDALAESRPNNHGPKELFDKQPGREAFNARPLESLKSNLKVNGQEDSTFDGTSKVPTVLLPEVHALSDKDSESSGDAQKKVNVHAQHSVESTANRNTGITRDRQTSETSSSLDAPAVHRSSVRSGLSVASTASLRNRDFPNLSASNMFMTPQTSRILDQHTKPLLYSVQKHKTEVSQEFSASLTAMSGKPGGFTRSQSQLPIELQQESSKSASFSADVDEMQRKIGRRLDALRESRLQKSSV